MSRARPFTPRPRALAADLPSGEQRFRTVVETAPCAILVVDTNGRVLEYNPAAERIHGWPRDEVVGADIAQLLPAPMLDRFRRTLDEVLGGADSHDFELTLRVRDDSLRVVSWNATRLCDDAGRPYGIVATGQDVTATKRAERALRESEELFRLLAETTPALIWMTDEHHACSYVNTAWTDLMGDSREALLGRAWERLIHPEDYARRQDEYASALRTRAPFTMDHRLRVADGTYRWIYGTATPRHAPDGAFTGYVACCVDVTERRVVEDLLRKTNEALEQRVNRRTAELTAIVGELKSEIAERKAVAGQLESVLRSSPDFILQIDREGRIAFLNRMLLGDASTIVGSTVFDWAPAAARPRIESALRRVFDEGLPDRYEGIVVGGDEAGRDTSYVFDIAPVVVDGRVESAVVNARDVTTSRLAEQRLRELEDEVAHAQRMSTMGTMAATIAHELHQPLAAVANYAGACTELLRSRRGRRADLAGYLEHITTQTLRAGDIIRRLRSFLEKRAPERVPVTIASIVEQAAPLLEVEAKQRGVELEFELADDVPSVLGDRVQLQQVLVNVVQNAIEATERSASRRRLVRIEADCPANRSVVELRVTDTGPGLSDDDRERVFEPFYTTKSAGMGFGLSISRTIAEAHGGSLVALARSGGGATFRLALPTHPEDITHAP